MPGRGHRIVTIAGIPITVSVWWLAVVALLTWSLGDGWFPEAVPGVAPAAAYALGFASALLLFASVVLHELGHAVVARTRGIEVDEIELWLLGGVAKLRGEAHRPGDELRYALAGPAVTAAIVAVCTLLLQLLGDRDSVAVALVEYQLIVNGLVLVFNLLPAFPLDGGRVLRALLWRRWHDRRRATAAAAAVGRAFGFALIALGVVSVGAGALGGIWLFVVGAFIAAAASAQAASAEIDRALGGIRAGDLMSAPVDVVAASTPAGHVAAEEFARRKHAAVPVVDDDGHLVGLLTLARVERLTAHERWARTAGELADRAPELAASQADDVVELLRRPGFARTGRIAVVDADRTPIGLLSVTDVERAVRAAAIAAPPRGRERTT